MAARYGTLTFKLRHVRSDAKAPTCDQVPRLRCEATTEIATTEPGTAWGGRDPDDKVMNSDAGQVWNDVGRVGRHTPRMHKVVTYCAKACTMGGKQPGRAFGDVARRRDRLEGGGVRRAEYGVYCGRTVADSGNLPCTDARGAGSS